LNADDAENADFRGSKYYLIIFVPFVFFVVNKIIRKHAINDLLLFLIYPLTICTIFLLNFIFYIKIYDFLSKNLYHWNSFSKDQIINLKSEFRIPKLL
jgi:hypothetical protein